MDYTSQSTKHDSENSKLKPVLKLTIEDILSEDLFVEELKNYPSTFLNKHITQEMIKKMISYIICDFSEEQLSEILKEKLKKNPDIRIESFKDVIYNLYSKKFPYNVSEILASDNPIILDFFFDPLKNEDHFEDLDDSPNQKSTNNSNEIENENKYELLDYFFNFLNCEKDLDVILCSYFLKIFTRFIISRSDQVLNYIYLLVDEVPWS